MSLVLTDSIERPKFKTSLPHGLKVGAIVLMLANGVSGAELPVGEDPDSDLLQGPDAVENQLEDNRKERPTTIQYQPLRDWHTWKQDVATATGFNFNLDYNVLGYKASESPGEDSALGGVIRFYGKWDLIGRGEADTGSLVFKLESREEYNGIAPADFGFELGYVGLLHCCFSDQGTRITNLYWRQSFNEQQIVSYTGFLDVTDYTDVYAMASPWTSFSNLVFSTGSGSMGGLPDGALGTMVAAWLSDTVYMIAGIADVNADPTDISQGFNTFFNDFETFKNIDFHWTPSKQELLLNQVHLSFYQVDAREEVGTEKGHGISFSATRTVDNRFLPFIRGGWSTGGGSLLEAALSIGLGYNQRGVEGPGLLGVGFNWGRPNEDTFGLKLEDQYTAEVFYRWDVMKGLELTPSLQLIADPALNQEEDFIYVLGLRARVVF
jgi:porin